MITHDQISRLVYALTLKCGHLPAASAKVIGLFGKMPERGPEMISDFEDVGIPKIIKMWARLIAKNADVSAFADAEWQLFEQRMAQRAPSLVEQAKNLAGALANEAAAIAKFGPPVSDELHRQRLSVCLTCDHLIPDKRQCSKCGCFIHYKARFRSQACPERKWLAVNAEDATAGPAA